MPTKEKVMCYWEKNMLAAVQSPPNQRYELALARAKVQLPRPIKTAIRRVVHLSPMRYPARQATEREQRCEHFFWNARHAENERRVKLEIREPMPLAEVRIVLHSFFELQCEIDDRIALRVFLEQVV